MSITGFLYYTFGKRIKKINILNYIPYDKKAVMEFLEKKIGWKSYGGKHHESVFTRFFQTYYLPRKFHIDKRRAHLSTLVCSGQLSRQDALNKMEKEIHPPDELERDKQYVIKKLGLSEEEFDKIMSLPAKSYRDYPSSYYLLKALLAVRRYVH
jgi:hypothetical protein